LEHLDFFLEVGLLVIELFSGFSEIILSLAQLRIKVGELIIAVVNILLIISNGSLKGKDGGIPLDKLSFVDLDFMF